MNLTVVFWIVFLFLLLIFVIYFMKQNPQADAVNEQTKSFVTADIKGSKFKLEVADTDAKRIDGLMNRKSLPHDQGMFFIFDMTGIYAFWMKNTLIPLDIIWLDSNKKVVYVKENAQPCSNIFKAVCQSIVPLKTSRYVIELNAGEVSKLGLKEGTIIKF